MITKPKTQTPITSTTVNLTADSLNDGDIAPWRSLYTFPSAKSVISEAATAYNQKIGGLTSGWSIIPCLRGTSMNFNINVSQLIQGSSPL